MRSRRSGYSPRCGFDNQFSLWTSILITVFLVSVILISYFGLPSYHNPSSANNQITAYSLMVVIELCCRGTNRLFWVRTVENPAMEDAEILKDRWKLWLGAVKAFISSWKGNNRFNARFILIRAGGNQLFSK